MIATQPTVTSFPLERPLLRARWRDATAGNNPALPFFIAGTENRLITSVCQSNSGVFDLGNPVLLIGPTGCGKTSLALHLAAQQAIALGQVQQVGAVKYLPAIDFARGFAEASAADDMPPFRAEIDDAPVLVIDDLHLMADKAPAQEELAARIEMRTDAQRPTLITCRRLPPEIRSFRPRLVSRTLHGLTLPIRLPSGEARRLILRELAMMNDVNLDEALFDALDAGLEDDLSVRALDGAMKQVSLWCRMNDSAVDLAAINNAIGATKRSDDVSLGKICRVVARRSGLKTADLRSSSRKQSVVRARSLAMLIARRQTGNSLDQIGKYFGGRDHSTVLHAIRKSESMLDSDTDLHQTHNDVTEKLFS
ncbi:helix-turn-helix domain-containing protein [Planctomycetes bacterium K23_9]|uniref:Chromosomal replication initiator protein DnaA n=1 Tax=Stieleria marina TaxID=1930275 RepID=A0A517NLR9_9BACT|nr:Chromosomal replication initiator protein DnaA [Planctomycetes bacterium K23_9]